MNYQLIVNALCSAKTCRRRSFFSTFFILLINISTSAIAADNQPIVVTATRTAQIADQTLTPTIVINSDDIELSQARDIAELLRFHAGIELGRNGGPGQNTSLFIRGTESDHVIVLIDGVKMNPRTIAQPALQNINPGIIERIEIVKGPRSALYGSEGIGGVINIITKRKASSGADMQAGLSAGDNYSNQYFGDIHYAGKILRTGITAERLTTDGFPSKTNADTNQGHENNSANAYIKLDYGATSFELSGWSANGTTEYLSFTLEDLSQDFKNQVATLTIKATMGNSINTTLKASSAVDELTQNDSEDFAKTQRDAFDLQLDWAASDDNLISFGLYRALEDVESLSFGAPVEQSNIATNAAFVQDDVTLGNFRLVAAIRYSDFEEFGNELTSNVDSAFRISKNTVLLFGMGKGFRAPTIFDMFGFGGTPNLEPEISQNIELGIRHRFNHRNSTSVTFFSNEINNLISWNSATSSLQNIDKAKIEGSEIRYEYKSPGISNYIEVTIQDPVDENTGEQLLRRSKKFLTAGFRVEN